MASLATWFTPSLQTISRSSGRSAVLAAAYRACAKLTDERLGITSDYTPKGKHGLAGNICIGIPNDDIGKLWNDAEKAETRANSTVARELMVPLPSDWSDVERAKCARGLGEMLRARYGVAVLVSIHRPSKDSNNHHAHILFTTRVVDAEGIFGEKTRVLDMAKTGEVKKMREAVCDIVNTHAIANGSDWYVYAGKFLDIIQDHIPTTHISIAHGKNQRKYIECNRAEVGEAISVIKKTKAQISAIDSEILELQQAPVIEESSHNTPQTVDDDYWDTFTPVPREEHLERITMPCGAQLAKEQLEKAHFAKADRRLQMQEWEKEQEQLSNNVPTPEYNFLGWPKKRYKDALAEHVEKLQAAQTAIAECVAKIKALDTYIKDPERNRLATAYHTTIAHNARADAELAERVEANAREYEMKHQQPTDWSAQLRDAEREMEQRRSRATATAYDSGGYGM